MPNITIKDNLDDLLRFKNSTETAVHLYIYGDIVSDWWGAWSDMDQYPESIKHFLDEANGREIIMHINSGGGNVFAGIAIYHMLKGYSGRKTAYIESLAGSISSLIPFAADRVVMLTGSALMVHRPYFYLRGGYRSDDMRGYADALDTLQENITDILCCHIKEGVERSVITEMLNKETWLNGEEAAEYFNVEIEEAPAIAGCTSEYIGKFALNKEMAAKYIVTDNRIKPSDNEQEALLINKNNEKGEAKLMTLAELKEKHPELVTEIENGVKADNIAFGRSEGAKEERARLKGIEDISASIGDAELLAKAKYGDSPLDAKEVAFAFLQKQSKIGADMLGALKADAEASGTEKVNPLGNTGVHSEAEELNSAVSLITGGSGK